LLVLLAGCQSMGHGPISEPIVGIGAALLAALDQLLASGVLTPEQYAPLAKGVVGISTVVQSTMDTAAELQKQVQATKAAQWSPTEIIGAVAGGSTVISAAAAKITNVLRDRHYTPDELAERRIKIIRAKAAKAKAA
jgi:hypothetical protein